MFNENLMLNGRQMLLEVEQDILVSFIRFLTCTHILSIFKIIVNLYQTKKIPNLGKNKIYAIWKRRFS